MKQARGAARTGKIDNHDRLINESQRPQTKVVRDSNVVKRAINLQPRRQGRAPRNTSQSKMRATLQRDGTDRRAAIDAKQGRLAIDKCSDEQVVLSRTGQWKRFEARRRRIRNTLALRSRHAHIGRCEQNRDDNRDYFREERAAGHFHAAENSMVPFARKRFRDWPGKSCVLALPDSDGVD